MNRVRSKLSGLVVIVAGTFLLAAAPNSAPAETEAGCDFGECVSTCPSMNDLVDWCASEAIARDCILTGGGCNNHVGSCTAPDVWKHCHGDAS